MSSVDISVGHRWQDDVRHIHSLRAHRPADTTLNLLELRDIVDIVIDGTNLTAPVSEEAIFGLFESTLAALVQLAEEQSNKAIIEFHYQPWELTLVPDGPVLRLSLYSVDRHRHVVARDLRIDTGSFINAACDAAGELLTGLFRISEHFSSHNRVRNISQSMARLKRLRHHRFCPVDPPDAVESPAMRVGSTSSRELSLGYRFNASDPPLVNYRGEHVFDLHALLFDGQVQAEFDTRTIVLSKGYPFLAISSLMDRARQLFNQLESKADAPFVLDEHLAHLHLSVRGSGTEWNLSVRDAERGELHDWNLPPHQCLDALVSVAELFVQDLVQTNAHLEVNERFLKLRREVETLRKWHRDLCCNNVYHDRPEDYLRQLGHLQPQSPSPAPEPRAPWPLSSVHRLFPRRLWTLREQRIDFSSLTLTADGLLISTSDGLQCLRPADGQTRWKKRLHPGPDRSAAMAVIGDRVLAHAGGSSLLVVNATDGGAECTVDVSAEFQGLSAAACYGDELTVAAARSGHLIGFHSLDGTELWSHSMGPGGAQHVVFDGPLVCTQSSEGVLTTLNPRTGDTLWKIRIGGTPEVAVQMHQGRLYTITHDPIHPASTLHSLYPFTGRHVWQLRLNGFCCAPPTFIDQWMVVPLERHGQIQLAGIDLEAVDPRINWTIELSSAGVDEPTSVMPVTLDATSHGLVRTDRAELTCFCVDDGQVRWRSMPASETLLMHGNLPLFRLGEAVVNISETVDLRHLATGKLLQSFAAIETPEFGFLAPPFRLLLGEQGPPRREADRLTAFSIDHFLAVVQ